MMTVLKIVLVCGFLGVLVYGSLWLADQVNDEGDE